MLWEFGLTFSCCCGLCCALCRAARLLYRLQALNAEDPLTTAHRAEMISLAADVAWVLFLHRVPRKLQASAATSCACGHLKATGVRHAVVIVHRS